MDNVLQEAKRFRKEIGKSAIVCWIGTCFSMYWCFNLYFIWIFISIIAILFSVVYFYMYRTIKRYEKDMEELEKEMYHD